MHEYFKKTLTHVTKIWNAALDFNLVGAVVMWRVMTQNEIVGGPNKRERAR